MNHPCSFAPARRRLLGLTLVESLVCVAILAILAGLAAPGMRDAIQLQRIASVRAELGTALQWSRWEALRRNSTVSLARRDGCGIVLRSADDWHCGWDVVASPSDQPSEVLQRFDLPRGVHLVHPGGGATLPFSRTGHPAQVAHRFVLGLPGATALGVAATPHAVTLCMNRTGRVRTVEGRTTC